MSKINALLIEDDIDLAEAISDYMEVDNIEFDFAYNGVSGLELASTNHYDVIVTDINMPKMNGLTMTQTLRTQGVATPILMLTARDTLEDKLTGFQAGSDDYLVKPFAMEELKVRLQALARRGLTSVSKLTIGDLSVDLQTHLAVRDGQELRLPPVCWKMLACLAKHSPNVVSKSQLEQAIWQDDVPAADSLKVHLFKLRQVVDTPFDTKLIHTIHGVGIALRENHDQH
ncbi:response regulator transcription factor [Vibrio sp. SCSIO 43140]|uniref:response regulator transcription factor n=1 Tax=Vibrio sp. SCSIO 43140 TaxID=2819100 RepID=UPI002075B37A|nr:response regulator transcription factor [Vibrio sp. SCSIO 43140]USD63265.1 response regulator transcription factor [Vibrio sp. SCSIO 43140]